MVSILGQPLELLLDRSKPGAILLANQLELPLLIEEHADRNMAKSMGLEIIDRLYPLKSPVFSLLALVVTGFFVFFIFHNVAMHMN